MGKEYLCMCAINMLEVIIIDLWLLGKYVTVRNLLTQHSKLTLSQTPQARYRLPTKIRLFLRI